MLADERTLSAREFGIYMNRWCQIADTGGVKQRHDTLHEFRALRMFEQFDGGWKLDGRFGPAQGAAIKELLDGFTANERLADWDVARQVHGEKTNLSHLARTENQRRADALEAGLLPGAAQPADAVRPEPSVHIVIIGAKR